ncbi:uncharacterized protein si:ch211-10d23.5 [Scomber japonicus]|uniref:uncharacterized protein si:ch211-10d23.5 n=1 Tax=Scomber japonicus TaxID=13676 RepID=UPI002305EB67|nr:uncharacterized protein si:ch211-10d23.5 [Scomber japonicus]
MRVGKITDFQQLLGSCVSFRVKALCTNGGKMSQIEELKLFVYERLQTAASEIFGAIEKTVTEYEERASRLKEDNDRHRSLIDIILKTKLPQKQASPATKSTPAAAGPGGASDSKVTSYQPNDLQFVFTSRRDFFKFVSDGNCPYCIKGIQATEKHLMRRHYLFAVHYTESGTEKFVVPCMCKDRIKGRSHWHCPYCTKIIFRKCNFEVHLSKQHGYTILQQGLESEMDQPSVPLSTEPWCQQDVSSLNREDQQASLLLTVKEEKEQGMQRQVSHQEVQYTDQLLRKGKQIKNGNHQIGEHRAADHDQDSALSIVCVDSFIQDISEINSMESGRRHSLCNSSPKVVETQPDAGVTKTQESAGEPPQITEGSSVAMDRRSSKTEEGNKNNQVLADKEWDKGAKIVTVRGAGVETGVNVIIDKACIVL